MCNKATFTKHEAEAALKRNKTGKQYRREQRAYYCHSCKAWHLTSKEHKNDNPVEDANLKYKKNWKKLLNN